MRICKPLLRCLSAGILVLAVLALPGIPARADTGTYKINTYNVTLEPNENGQVRITIEQTWKVLSGHIPWVTVGLPNTNFSIESKSGAASRVSPANSGGFSGVRIDLDRDYQPGEIFTLKFSVMQGNLLERLTSENKWRIDYTPGWYDRAETGKLQIELISPVAVDSYSLLDPTPDSTVGDVLNWEKTNLSDGEKFRIRIECLDGGFLKEVIPVKPENPVDWGMIIFIIILIAAAGTIIWAIWKNRRERELTLNQRLAEIEQKMAVDKETREKIENGFEKYAEKELLIPDEQGRYYDKSYGGYVTPALWAATIMNRSNRIHVSKADTTNTHNSSCACACVACACACACACAGGGGAGCSRKTLHECEECLPQDIPTTEETVSTG